MVFDAIQQAVIAGDAPGVEENVRDALENGTEASELLYEALIPAMREVGRRYETGDFFVPEMLVAARAMKAGLVLLRPLLTDAGGNSAGTVVIGTVQGDLHDIGKNLVSLMLEGAGFEVRDLGVDVPPQRFVEAVSDDVQIVAMSALLTTTMPAMTAVIEELTEAGVRDRVKVMVGGAPVTLDYANKVGADGFAPDASSAARLAQDLLKS